MVEAVDKGRRRSSIFGKEINAKTYPHKSAWCRKLHLNFPPEYKDQLRQKLDESVVLYNSLVKQRKDKSKDRSLSVSQDKGKPICDEIMRKIDDPNSSENIIQAYREQSALFLKTRELERIELLDSLETIKLYSGKIYKEIM